MYAGSEALVLKSIAPPDTANTPPTVPVPAILTLLAIVTVEPKFAAPPTLSEDY